MVAAGLPESLKRPKPGKPLPCHLEQISVALKPSLQEFEEQLLQQLNQDRGKTEVGNPDDMPRVKIEKRYLQVLVHRASRRPRPQYFSGRPVSCF